MKIRTWNLFWNTWEERWEQIIWLRKKGLSDRMEIAYNFTAKHWSQEFYVDENRNSLSEERWSWAPISNWCQLESTGNSGKHLKLLPNVEIFFFFLRFLNAHVSGYIEMGTLKTYSWLTIVWLNLQQLKGSSWGDHLFSSLSRVAPSALEGRKAFEVSVM